MHELYNSLVLMQTNLPDGISPNFNWKGVDLVKTGLSVLLGAGILVCIGVAFIGTIKLATRAASDKAGGYIGPAKQVGMSVLVIFVLYNIMAFLQGWVNIFPA